jgi:hypothetical protein
MNQSSHPTCFVNLTRAKKRKRTHTEASTVKAITMPTTFGPWFSFTNMASCAGGIGGSLSMLKVIDSVRFKVSDTKERRSFTKVPEHVDPSAQRPYIACNTCNGIAFSIGLRVMWAISESLIMRLCLISGKIGRQEAHSLARQHTNTGLAFPRPVVWNRVPGTGLLMRKQRTA